MTKANVIQFGIALLFLGGLGYAGLVLIGVDESKAVIASEGLLFFVVVGWVLSYFFRVISGQMTFVEQRKRYRKEYERIVDRELQEKFDLMSNDEKMSLIQSVEAEKHDNKENP